MALWLNLVVNQSEHRTGRGGWEPYRRIPAPRHGARDTVADSEALLNAGPLLHRRATQGEAPPLRVALFEAHLRATHTILQQGTCLVCFVFSPQGCESRHIRDIRGFNGTWRSMGPGN